ncbi:hypothetical protein ACS0TY_026918 [Phlomoides rotata]
MASFTSCSMKFAVRDAFISALIVLWKSDCGSFGRLAHDSLNLYIMLSKYGCSSGDINPIGSINQLDLRAFLKWASNNLGYSSLAQLQLAARPNIKLDSVVCISFEGVFYYSKINLCYLIIFEQHGNVDDMGMKEEETSIYARLRRTFRSGPVSMFELDPLSPFLIFNFCNFRFSTHPRHCLTPVLIFLFSWLEKIHVPAWCRTAVAGGSESEDSASEGSEGSATEAMVSIGEDVFGFVQEDTSSKSGQVSASGGTSTTTVGFQASSIHVELLAVVSGQLHTEVSKQLNSDVSCTSVSHTCAPVSNVEVSSTSASNTSAAVLKLKKVGTSIERIEIAGLGFVECGPGLAHRTRSVNQTSGEKWGNHCRGELEIVEINDYWFRERFDVLSPRKVGHAGPKQVTYLYITAVIPYHRIGAKYKIYRTYDFCCPFVDAVEGITHALRSSEYHDRNDQYYRIQQDMGFRKVHIYEISRLNVVYTLLSKRKLLWFVQYGKVEGWDDPRFPTVQGIVRRGLKIEALIQFILEQGASKNLNLMEWDKLWAINKKISDLVSPRHTAIGEERRVLLILIDGHKDPFEVLIKTTKLELTWLADNNEIVRLMLVDFDYLITKKKLEEDEDFVDVVNPSTRTETSALGECDMRNLKRGDVIQLERGDGITVVIPLLFDFQSP